MIQFKVNQEYETYTTTTGNKVQLTINSVTPKRKYAKVQVKTTLSNYETKVYIKVDGDIEKLQFSADSPEWNLLDVKARIETVKQSLLEKYTEKVISNSGKEHRVVYILDLANFLKELFDKKITYTVMASNLDPLRSFICVFENESGLYITRVYDEEVYL